MRNNGLIKLTRFSIWILLILHKINEYFNPSIWYISSKNKYHLKTELGKQIKFELFRVMQLDVCWTQQHHCIQKKPKIDI